MNLRPWLTAVVVTAVLSCALPAQGRFVENWPCQKLMEKSDVVAIVEPVKNEYNADQFEWEPQLAQGISTTFKVLCCMKGNTTGDQLVLKHFIYKSIVPPNAAELVNFLIGPLDLKIKFDRNGKSNDWEHPNLTPHWLVFLTKNADGTYAPVSGQIDPNFSFQELHSPSMYGTI